MSKVDVVEVDDYGLTESNKDLAIEILSSSLKESRENKKRAKFIKDVMIPSWGFWKSGGGNQESPTSKACSCVEGDIVVVDAYESSMLPDYLSDMYVVDDAVMRLNRIQSELIRCEFIADYVEQSSGHVYDFSGRISYWCGEFGTSKSNYRKVKERAIKKIIELILK